MQGEELPQKSGVLVRVLALGGFALLIASIVFALVPRHGPAIEESEMQTRNDLPQEAQVVDVVDGDTVVLDNGMELRFTGIQAPKLPLGRPGFRAWPFSDEARDAMVELAQDAWLRLDYNGTPIDRHGRLLAHAYRQSDDLWLQEEMLRRGLARVYSFEDNRAGIDRLLAAEREARAAGRGIWSDDYYAIRDALDDVGEDNSFQLVEGVVRDVGEGGGRVYLNFDANWREDFTIMLDRDAQRLFRRDGVDPEDYEGRRIRVRGWIRHYNGPAMDVSHPEQIEILDGE